MSIGAEQDSSSENDNDINDDDNDDDEDNDDDDGGPEAQVYIYLNFVVCKMLSAKKTVIYRNTQTWQSRWVHSALWRATLAITYTSY